MTCQGHHEKAHPYLGDFGFRISATQNCFYETTAIKKNPSHRATNLTVGPEQPAESKSATQTTMDIKCITSPPAQGHNSQPEYVKNAMLYNIYSVVVY